MNQLRAQLIQEVVQMGETEGWNQKPEEERPSARPAASRCRHVESGHVSSKRMEEKR